MSTIHVKVPGTAFANGVAVGDDNKVISSDTNKYPSLSCIAEGMVIQSINKVPIGSAREEQGRYRHHSGDIDIGVTSGAKDEFDLTSDDDEADDFHPATALPALPPEMHNATAHHSADVVYDAAKKCGPGRCVIIMCEGANPALPIAFAAEKAKVDVMYIDTVARMKTRQRIDDAGEVFKKSLEKGLWIYLEQATKSIMLLQKLAECTEEVASSGRMHHKARVFLMCEPHPHFPEALMKGCVTLRSRLQGGNIAEVDLKEDLMESKKRVMVLHGDTVNPTEMNGARPAVAKTKKKVKISSEVNVVQLEKSTFLEMSASAAPPADRDAVSAGEGGLTRVAKYTFGSNEKFISLCRVNDHRFVVGTNSGYVVLLDSDGLPLIQFRPHKACVWDVAFATQFDFVTACEDGTSTIFNYSLAGQELIATSVASFQSDVFAVTYAVEHDLNSAVLSGGLSATICILHSDRQNSSFIASGTSIQAMRASQYGKVVVGGGNGVCSLIDPEQCVLVDTTNKHIRKVPAVGCHGALAATGGFDRMLRLWDVRSGFNLTCERPTADVVTAVAVSEKYTAVCCGADLFVWDMRQMATPLATRHNAWKDLTRGLVIDDNLIVTASVDGVARFWEIN